MKQIIKHIDISLAKIKLKDDGVVVFDIRDSQSFIEGHIHGAINLSSSNFDDIVNKFDKSNTVIVYCYHGNSSQTAAKLLAEHGFLDVYSLDGGYEEWKVN